MSTDQLDALAHEVIQRVQICAYAAVATRDRAEAKRVLAEGIKELRDIEGELADAEIRASLDWTIAQMERAEAEL
ncbi:hypothetical protein GCM10022237_08890 [Nocardioides ginsengisoli]|uniref:DUF892 family protein n=1 Tax=Nocardioides ginsengisoli TaxID=363868 RepID=A0ABW3VZT7_9ACTN